MVRVITYGTYDLLHYGHINLLKRAKLLGDYLIVGITADDFDKARGKINVKQSLMERIEAVKETGIADEIIVEEYEGQKIDDIKRYNIDIFTVGSDWIGKFDYLSEYCRVVYLERTEGVSSSELRAGERSIRLGLVGETSVLYKYYKESSYVNGVDIAGVYSEDQEISDFFRKEKIQVLSKYDRLLESVDAVYVASHPTKHYSQVKRALMANKHVLCESPIALSSTECKELFGLAQEKSLILMDAIKTAYATAYNRMLLLVKGGKIGRILSVDSTCTSLQAIDIMNEKKFEYTWNSICGWGPTAMLPIFQILGTTYNASNIVSLFVDEEKKFDLFTKVDFIYSNAVASLKVGKGVKSEGQLIVSGTKGYIYIPAPWWKTDYFEIRFENQEENKRYFYHLEGEGIRYEIVAFLKSIATGKINTYIDEVVSEKIVSIIEQFERKEGLYNI